MYRGTLAGFIKPIESGDKASWGVARTGSLLLTLRMVRGTGAWATVRWSTFSLNTSSLSYNITVCSAGYPVEHRPSSTVYVLGQHI